MRKIIKLMSLFMTSTLLFGTVCNASTTNSVYTNTNGFTETNDENSEEFIQPRFTYKVVTASGNLNVRKKPNTKSAIVGRIAKGSIADCSAIQPGDINEHWLYGSGIDADTGKRVTGYMCSDYLKITTEP